MIRRGGHRVSLFLGVALSALSGGCSPEKTSPPAGPVPEGAFARVGASVLSLDLLGAVGGDGRAAATGIVHDELFRQETSLLAPHRARVAERGVLARHLFESLEREAAHAKLVSEKALLEERERNWVKYDRPRSVRTAQLFIRVLPLADDRAAHELAMRVLEAVKDSKNVEHFVQRGREAARGKEISAEPLPPLTETGLVVPLLLQDVGYESFPQELGAAAAKLDAPGEISDVIGSEHGFHLLFAMEVIPEQRVTLEEAREELTRAVVARRVKERLAELRAESKVAVSVERDDIGALLRQVRSDR